MDKDKHTITEWQLIESKLCYNKKILEAVITLMLYGDGIFHDFNKGIGMNCPKELMEKILDRQNNGIKYYNEKNAKVKSLRAVEEFIHELGDCFEYIEAKIKEEQEND